MAESRGEREEKREATKVLLRISRAQERRSRPRSLSFFLSTPTSTRKRRNHRIVGNPPTDASLSFFRSPSLLKTPLKPTKNQSKIKGFGAAYGTAKSGVGIASMGVMRPELVMKSIVPVVMAGVLGIYGLIIAVIISTGSE